MIDVHYEIYRNKLISAAMKHASSVAGPCPGTSGKPTPEQIQAIYAWDDKWNQAFHAEMAKSYKIKVLSDKIAHAIDRKRLLDEEIVSMSAELGQIVTEGGC